jgi:hypothetical protein
MNSKHKKPSIMKNYFDDDDDDNDDVYDSLSTAASSSGGGKFDSSTSFSSSSFKAPNNSNNNNIPDPLDIFMMGVEEQIKRDEDNKHKNISTEVVLPEILSGNDIYDDNSDEEYDRIYTGNDTSTCIYIVYGLYK